MKKFLPLLMIMMILVAACGGSSDMAAESASTGGMAAPPAEPMADDFYMEEMAEMDDILTRIQWQRYVKIRPEIQPLEQLKEDN